MILILFIILQIHLFTGCSSTTTDKMLYSNSDIELGNWSMYVGAGNNKDTQIVTYDLYFINHSVNKKILKWIEPSYTRGMAERILNKSSKIEINKSMLPGSNYKLELKLTIDSKGLSKNDFTLNNPILKDIIIVEEHTSKINILLPDKKTKK